MRDQSIRAAFPLVQSEGDQQRQANRERHSDVHISPGVRAAGPVERQQQQRRRRDEEQRADRVQRPEQLARRHLREIRPPLRVVESDQADRRRRVERRLHPENISPATRVRIRHRAGAHTAHETAHPAAYEGEAVG